jgi:uncharacterized protein DUF3224
MDTLDTTLPIESWDEEAVEELPDGGAVKRAEVTLGAGPDALGPGTMHSLLHYAPDGTSTYVTLLHLRGGLDGRTGGLVLLGEGAYDGTTARGEMRVVGAGGELTGLTGSATSESTQSDYPDMPVSITYASA